MDCFNSLLAAWFRMVFLGKAAPEGALVWKTEFGFAALLHGIAVVAVGQVVESL